MARPQTYSLDAIVSINTLKAKSRLQPGGERRAVVNRIVDHGGRMKISELNEELGYDTRSRVAALARSGWLLVQTSDETQEVGV